jgi:hypothetical protein
MGEYYAAGTRLAQYINLSGDADILYVASAANDSGDIDRAPGDNSSEYVLNADPATGANGIGHKYPASLPGMVKCSGPVPVGTTWPQCIPDHDPPTNMITVAAALPTLDGNNPAAVNGEALHHVSNWGSEGSVHIVAPGRSLITTWPGNARERVGQTSTAAAVVSGCAALMQARRLEMGMPLLEPDDLKDILISSADQPIVPASQPNQPTDALQLVYSRMIDGGRKNLVHEGRRLNCHEAIHAAIDVCGDGDCAPPAAPTGLSAQ